MDLEAVQANQIVPYGLLSIQANHIVPYGLRSVQANQIVPYGLKSRTSRSYCSIRSQNPYKPIRSFYTDSKTVQANQIARTFNGKNFRKDQGTRIIINRVSDKTRRSFRKESSTRSDGQTLKLKSLTRKSRTLYA